MAPGRCSSPLRMPIAGSRRHRSMHFGGVATNRSLRPSSAVSVSSALFEPRLGLSCLSFGHERKRNGILVRGFAPHNQVSVSGQRSPNAALGCVSTLLEVPPGPCLIAKATDQQGSFVLGRAVEVVGCCRMQRRLPEGPVAGCDLSMTGLEESSDHGESAFNEGPSLAD